MVSLLPFTSSSLPPYRRFTSPCHYSFLSFFFNDTATTEIYTLSLHDALPIYALDDTARQKLLVLVPALMHCAGDPPDIESARRSEEHTSELQSHVNLVCRLLLEKKKKHNNNNPSDQKHPTYAAHNRLLLK